MATSSRESQILLAIEAIEHNPKLSRRRAAAIYNVPESSLCDRMNGRISRRDCRPNSHKLIDIEEETILQYTLDLDVREFSPRLTSIEDMANLLLAEHNGGRVVKRWAENFVKRQPELKIRFNRVYDFQRALCENSKLISK